MLVPKQIDIEVTSRCNLKCKLCPAWTGNATAMDMHYDIFTSIIDRVVKEKIKCVIVPWLNGEPLLHPRYHHIIKYITLRNLPAYITTNGTIWNDKLFGLITEDTSIYQIIFSLDGLWDETSKSIEIARPGSKRAVIRENIEGFIKLKREKKAKLDICLKICRRGQDWEEIENFIAYWLTHGADFVCLGDALDKINEESMRLYPCQYSDNNFMVIKSDGRVTRCAYNDQATNNHKWTMGDIKNDKPLLEIYNNERFQAFRRLQHQGLFSGPCYKCGFAYTGAGYRGTVRFRDPKIDIGTIFYQRDYYNTFYSLERKWKDDNYYGFKKD